MLTLKETDHSYYCNQTNYYVGGAENHGRRDYANWEEFKESWLDADLSIDDDYNHLFRFDITQAADEEGETIEGAFELWLFFILQRKGIYRPVWIKEILEKDLKEINEFLEKRWMYMQGQWAEFLEL